jgi:hypothetical protein
LLAIIIKHASFSLLLLLLLPYAVSLTQEAASCGALSEQGFCSDTHHCINSSALCAAG